MNYFTGGMQMDNGKIDRVHGIYTKLMSGGVVKKAEEARRYDVNDRTIQRDIDDIRNFLESDAEHTGIINSVIYSLS
jgi:predicted DNA-binding transcriptional regulator YafY